MFKTIEKNVISEITEKKSKFICNVYHVESVDEAEDILKKMRKKYHDARHNCFAYKIAKGDISRASDDGEPSGTAGQPMLNILNGRNLSNILVVVTRYFGGILLGTGGLVRAYSLATTEAIDNAVIVEKDIGLEIKFCIEYNELEELKYQFKNMKIKITNLEYGEKICITAEGKNDDIRKIMNGKISDRITLKNIELIGEKFILI